MLFLLPFFSSPLLVLSVPGLPVGVLSLSVWVVGLSVRALVMLFSYRIGQSASAMVPRRNAVDGSNVTTPRSAVAIILEKHAAWVKAQPALVPRVCANVYPWRSPHHSPSLSATIYTGHGLH